MASNLPLVLITGATGFVGAHILQEALAAGYPVRATARSAKVQDLYKVYDGKVDVVAVDDIVNGDYTEALKGVGAIIHVAAPLYNKADAAGMIEGTVEGSQNILRQAAKHGVAKFVLTSSWVTSIDYDRPEVIFSDYRYTVDDWNPATREETLSGKHDLAYAYCASKTIAERELWKFADVHPEIDITTINPPYIYGPIPAKTRLTKADLSEYSTIRFFYDAVLSPKGSATKLVTPQSIPPVTCDVRDVALAHVRALSAPSTKDVGRKRILVAGPPLTWKGAVEHIAAVRPELKSRLPEISDAKDTKIASVDVSMAKELLGLATYIDWKKTLEDMVDSIVAVENGSKESA